MKVRCPRCGTQARWKDNPSRPFCSERCKTVDLANWADGSYRLPGEVVSEDDLEPIDDGTRD